MRNTFGVGKTSVWRIVEEFCDAIIGRFYAEEIKFPRSEEEMAAAAQNFLRRWQFPGVLGAIDGSHIPILTPEENGEEYYNYKGWHSVILLAVADHSYRYGRTHCVPLLYTITGMAALSFFLLVDSLM